jgi:hypothetical protein
MGLESIWGSPAGLKIQEHEGKILQFFMDDSRDHDRILLGNPWIFRNHCKTKQMGECIGALLGRVEAAEMYEYPEKK